MYFILLSKISAFIIEQKKKYYKFILHEFHIHVNTV